MGNLPVLVELKHDFYGLKFTSWLSLIVWGLVDSHEVDPVYLDDTRKIGSVYYLMEYFWEGIKMFRFCIRLLLLGLGITSIAAVVNGDLPVWVATFAALWLAVYTAWEE